MSNLVPIKFWSLRVPADGMIVGLEETETGLPNMQVRITMAAIDPTAEPEVDGEGPKLSTLKIIHAPSALNDDFMGSDDEDDSDFDSDEDSEDDSELDSDEEESEDENGAGPSKTKAGSSKKGAQKEAAAKELKKAIDEAEAMDMDMEIDSLIKRAKGKSKAKGKGKEASDEDEEEGSSDEDLDDEDDSDDDDESLEIEEAVVCTLDPLKMYQQPLDITIGEEEQVFFKAVGAFPIYLTGNFVVNAEDNDMYDPDSDEDSELDLSPDEDELELMNGYDSDELDDDESDELDDVDNPRITELDEDDEEAAAKKAKAVAEVLASTKNLSKKEKKSAAHAARVAAAIVEKDVKEDEKKTTPSKKEEKAEKGKKRPAADEDVSMTTDDLPKDAKKDEKTGGEQKLSKKQLKKLKANSGEAAPAPTDSPATEAKKKVQFAANLETGPTPNGNKSSPAAAAGAAAKPAAPQKTSRNVGGVTVEDHATGAGPEAKKGNKVAMRYVGKLPNGKVFDSNKKGKPFSFKLGAGEVIKGWDIGVAGMKAGGERKLTIPANLAYGSQPPPGIPRNSTLIFEVKLLEIK